MASMGGNSSQKMEQEAGRMWTLHCRANPVIDIDMCNTLLMQKMLFALPETWVRSESELQTCVFYVWLFVFVCAMCSLCLHRVIIPFNDIDFVLMCIGNNIYQLSLFNITHHLYFYIIKTSCMICF